MKKKLMPQDIVLLNEESVAVFMSQLQLVFSNNYIKKRNFQIKYYTAVLLIIFATWNIQDLISLGVIGSKIIVTGVPKFMLIYFDNVGEILDNKVTIDILLFPTELDLKKLIELNELKYCTTNLLDEHWGN
jgi:hypothetical protein